MKQIIIATKNKGKIEEFQELFSPYHIKVMSLLDVTKTFNIEETGTTFLENAQIKAEQTKKYLNLPVLADDSGLEIDALNGRPGIYSSRYAKEDATDQENIDKVMQELENVPYHRRTARFVCALTLSLLNGQMIHRIGYCEGKIALSQAGENGFGYDPIFIPKHHKQTMAQLHPDVKNRISHRGRAIEQLEKWLKHNIDKL